METYTIRDLMRQFQLPASTLRYYEEQGLLPAVDRTPSGQRMYDSRHVSRLETIRCFKGTGMTIAQLRQLFAYEAEGAVNTEAILALLRDQRDRVKCQLLEMQENLSHVERKIQRYEAQQAAEKSN